MNNYYFKWGFVNHCGNGCVEVPYRFINEDTIEYITPDGRKWMTHYKSLWV